jgi:hypothetical protein
LVARLSATPGQLRWTGRPVNADGAQIRAELDALEPLDRQRAERA